MKDIVHEDTAEMPTRKRKHVEVKPPEGVKASVGGTSVEGSPIKALPVKQQKSLEKGPSPVKPYKRRVDKRIRQKRLKLSDGVPPVDDKLIEPVDTCARALDFQTENTPPNTSTLVVGTPKVDSSTNVSKGSTDAAKSEAKGLNLPEPVTEGAKGKQDITTHGSAATEKTEVDSIDAVLRDLLVRPQKKARKRGSGKEGRSKSIKASVKAPGVKRSVDRSASTRKPSNAKKLSKPTTAIKVKKEPSELGSVGKVELNVKEGVSEGCVASTACSLAQGLATERDHGLVYFDSENFTTGVTVLMPTRMVQEKSKQTVLPPQLYRPLLEGASVSKCSFKQLDALVHETLDDSPTSAVMLNVKGGFANDRSQLWKRYLQQRKYPLQSEEAAGDIKGSLLANKVVRGLGGLKDWLDSNNYCFFCLHYAFIPGKETDGGSNWQLAPVIGEDGSETCDYGVSDIQVRILA